MQLSIFQCPPVQPYVNSLVILVNVKQGHELDLTHLYACWIMQGSTIGKY